MFDYKNPAVNRMRARLESQYPNNPYVIIGYLMETIDRMAMNHPEVAKKLGAREVVVEERERLLAEFGRRG